MKNSMTVQLAQRGLITLPKALRQAYNLNPGDEMSILDLGGVFVLSPRRSEVDVLADKISSALIDDGESLESMLRALRESRENYEG